MLRRQESLNSVGKNSVRIRSFCGLLNMDWFDRLLSMDYYACVGLVILVLSGELRRFFIEVLFFLLILQRLSHSGGGGSGDSRNLSGLHRCGAVCKSAGYYWQRKYARIAKRWNLRRNKRNRSWGSGQWVSFDYMITTGGGAKTDYKLSSDSRGNCGAKNATEYDWKEKCVEPDGQSQMQGSVERQCQFIGK